MPRFVLSLIIACFVVTTPAIAAEELPIEKLEVQAKIPQSGDFMAFGFDSLWMMSDGDMIRVNPTDNSVSEIKVPGAVGRYRGIAIGEGAVWIPDSGSKTNLQARPKHQ
jgi:hypothetical protein